MSNSPDLFYTHMMKQSMPCLSWTTRIAGLAIAVSLTGSAVVSSHTARAQAPAALPDWSGVWAMEGPTVFDRATVQPPNGRSGQPGVREFPPYTEEWEAIYRRNIELVAQGLFPDPISACGVPHGFPRIMNVPDVYEFAVTRDCGVRARGERSRHHAYLHGRSRAIRPPKSCGLPTPAHRLAAGKETRSCSRRSA